MTIITLDTQSVSKAMGAVNTGIIISMPHSDMPLQMLGDNTDLAKFRHTSEIFRINIQKAIKVTAAMLTPANMATGGDFRSAEYEMGSIDVVQSLHPLTISISVPLMDQSLFSHQALAARVLARYKMDLTEIKLANMLIRSAIVYNCSQGTNTKSPTECTTKDLMAVSSMLRNSGMQPVLSQYMASIGISTSGIPKSYAMVGSNDSINEILSAIDATNLLSFKFAHNYSGSTNYSQNARGCETVSAISFITSNNFSAVSGPGIHKTIIVSANSYFVASSTPTSDSIIMTDRYVCSYPGLISRISTPAPFAAACYRPEGIREFNFSEKK